MLEKFKKNALTSNQMKVVKGGDDTYSCNCVSGGGSYTCYGDQQTQIACANYYCGGNADCIIQ